MTNLFTQLFNWKKHPASVFTFVWPLAFIAFGLFALRAYLEWRDNGRWGFMVIEMIALALLYGGLNPVWSRYKQLMAKEHDDEQEAD